MVPAVEAPPNYFRGAVMQQEETDQSSEVSFFKLAEQYDMPRGRRRRWGDERDGQPGRRRRRRLHRRDRDASRDYYPMEVDANSASRGIRTRLVGAMASAMVTVICLLSIVFAPEITLGSIFPFTVAVGSLGLSVALTMSARREEIVHQVAGQLAADDEPDRALPPPGPDQKPLELELERHRVDERQHRHREVEQRS